MPTTKASGHRHFCFPSLSRMICGESYSGFPLDLIRSASVPKRCVYLGTDGSAVADKRQAKARTAAQAATIWKSSAFSTRDLQFCGGSSGRQESVALLIGTVRSARIMIQINRALRATLRSHKPDSAPSRYVMAIAEANVGRNTSGARMSAGGGQSGDSGSQNLVLRPGLGRHSTLRSSDEPRCSLARQTLHGNKVIPLVQASTSYA